MKKKNETSITHILKLEIYLIESKYLSESDIRNQYIGYFEAKNPDLDIENIVVKKVE